MKLLRILFLCLLGWFAVPAQAKECLGFGSAPSSPEEVDRFYALRAVEIVRASLNGDRKKLDGMVSPGATFAIWRGDYATGGRSVGVNGAIEMARDLKPENYRISVKSVGPIAVAPSACTWDAFVAFTTTTASEGVTMKFSFSDGLLVKADGHQVTLTEGRLP